MPSGDMLRLPMVLDLAPRILWAKLFFLESICACCAASFSLSRPLDGGSTGWCSFQESTRTEPNRLTTMNRFDACMRIESSLSSVGRATHVGGILIDNSGFVVVEVSFLCRTMVLVEIDVLVHWSRAAKLHVERVFRESLHGCLS